MKRSVLGALGIVAVLVAAVVALASPFNNPATHAASSLQFEATFATSGDFFGRFDYGYSGANPYLFGDSIFHFHGDHDMNCGGPTTDRDVAFAGNNPNLDFSQLFWYCAPGGDGAKGHIMTGVDTHGYNIAWFSPKPMFSNVTKVCWDINETAMSRRKWTQVLFVSQADATRYPTGIATVTGGIPSVARGTGGFDLGYTSPDFRQDMPNTGIFPQGGTLAGFKSISGDAEWFQNQDTWTTRDQGPGNLIEGVTDKAARYQHCLENQPNNIVRLTQQTPTGTRTFDLQGQIPSGSVRVVFQDDNYNPSKDEFYSPTVLTWHWDNIQVFTDDGTGAPATTAPPTTAPTTTVAPTTTAAPTTTVAPTTTQAPTTTAAPTTVATTVAGTVAPTTVATTAAPTTVGPIDLTAAPTTAVSTTAASTTVAPTTVATTAAPTTVATTVAPTTVATTAAPTTVATTVAPTTVATTVAPTTAAPTTVATTAAPTTVAPTTVAPTTAAPTTVATTVAPTTAAPTTVATTVAPTTAAPLGAQSGDTTPPAITITGGPAGTTTDRDAVITFTATDGTQEFSAGSAVTFTGALDGGAASVVTSPVRIAGLPLGDHVLVIKATDEAGNVGSARVTWTVVAAPNNLTGRTGPARGSSAPSVIAAHKSALEAAIKGGGLGTKVADNVVVRTAVPPPAQEVLAQTGARTMENVVLGLTLIGLGLVLAGVASGFRRRTS